MRTYSKSLAIANRILGSETSKSYCVVSSQGAVYSNLVFGVIDVFEEDIYLQAIDLQIQEAGQQDIICQLVKITPGFDDLTEVDNELDSSGSNIEITLPQGDRHVSKKISTHTLSRSNKYGLKVKAGSMEVSVDDVSYGEGLSATYILTDV